MCDHPEATADDYLQEVVLPLVARSGWAVQAVGPSPTRAQWAYTVGLTTGGMPELVVTGKQPVAAQDLLDAVVAQALLTEPAPGRRFDIPLGPSLQILQVSDPRRLVTATTLYGGKVRALQVVWADAGGRWPWEIAGSPQWLLGRPGLSERRAS